MISIVIGVIHRMIYLRFKVGKRNDSIYLQNNVIKAYLVICIFRTQKLDTIKVTWT